LHEVDLVRVDVEGDAGKQLVIKPFAPVACRQMVRRWQVALVGPLRRIVGIVVAQFAFHPIDPFPRLDRVTLAEQAGQTGVSDGNMQVIGIIVGDGLPVKVARSERDPADRPQVLKPIRRHLLLVRRHHLVNRWQAFLQPDEQEAAPGFQRHGHQPELLRL